MRKISEVKSEAKPVLDHDELPAHFLVRLHPMLETSLLGAAASRDFCFLRGSDR